MARHLAARVWGPKRQKEKTKQKTKKKDIHKCDMGTKDGQKGPQLQPAQPLFANCTMGEICKSNGKIKVFK